MIIHVKQSCEFKSPAGLVYQCRNGFIGTPPEWVEHDSFFKLLCSAGLITAHVDSKAVDKDTDEKPEKVSKKK